MKKICLPLIMVALVACTSSTTTIIAAPSSSSPASPSPTASLTLDPCDARNEFVTALQDFTNKTATQEDLVAEFDQAQADLNTAAEGQGHDLTESLQALAVIAGGFRDQIDQGKDHTYLELGLGS